MNESVSDSAERQFKSAQAKITFLGTQSKPIATVIFSTQGQRASMKRFNEAHRSKAPYTNDDLPYTTQFGVTAEEFARMMSAVEPILSKADAARVGVLSFTVVRETEAGVEGQESFVDSASGPEFYRKLIDALEEKNEAGRAALTKQFTNIYPQ